MGCGTCSLRSVQISWEKRCCCSVLSGASKAHEGIPSACPCPGGLRLSACFPLLLSLALFIPFVPPRCAFRSSMLGWLPFRATLRASVVLVPKPAVVLGEAVSLPWRRHCRGVVGSGLGAVPAPASSRMAVNGDGRRVRSDHKAPAGVGSPRWKCLCASQLQGSGFTMQLQPGGCCSVFTGSAGSSATKFSSDVFEAGFSGDLAMLGWTQRSQRSVPNQPILLFYDWLMCLYSKLGGIYSNKFDLVHLF